MREKEIKEKNHEIEQLKILVNKNKVKEEHSKSSYLKRIEVLIHEKAELENELKVRAAKKKSHLLKNERKKKKI